MKPLVNLSSNPFRNRRLFWLLILLLFLVPAYLGMQANDTATKLERDISDQSAKVAKLDLELKKVIKPVTSNVSISPDQNKQLVAASELIARRAFSWSQLLTDIERALPAGVRVLRVAVAQIQPKERDEIFNGNENSATLSLTVIGKSGQDVTTMINRFHDSGRFKVFPVSKKAVEGTEDVEFELRIEYLSPVSSASVNPSNQIASAKTGEKK
ncbi:MAG: hypothetical protein AB7P14_12690 [Blastocatellales bacterium]